MLPLISVIVPVFNSEKYVRRSVDSILGQTYSNLEVLLVDDGSTDRSGEICDEYKVQDKRVKVIHKLNEGVSVARNVGLDAATGKYIGFVDGDDWCESDMFAYLYHLIAVNGTEISMCGYFFEKMNGKQVIECRLPATKMLLNAEAAIKSISGSKQYEKSGYNVWNKLFSKTLIDQEKIRFPKNIMTAEDALFLAHCILATDQVVYGTLPKYHYCQNPDSSLNLVKATKKFDQGKLIQLKVLYHLANLAGERYPGAAKYVQATICGAGLILFRDYSLAGTSNPRIKRLLVREIRTNLNSLLFSDVGSVKVKIAAVFSSIFPDFFCLLFKLKS